MRQAIWRPRRKWFEKYYKLGQETSDELKDLMLMYGGKIL